MLVAAVLSAAACAREQPSPDETRPDPQPLESDTAPARATESDALPELPVLREPARGLGSMTARVPGTSEVVGGVSLARHDVRVSIAGGIAHTEVEEEFHNDTHRVLEGRLVFPLPADAALGRLALWVDGKLIEGEVVERLRADRIFRGIVDDTVRPRDPALLDVLSGGKVSLRIFPIPARQSRKVLFAYDQVLRRTESGMRYVYPLSLGSDRATRVGTLSVTINGVTRVSVRNATDLDDVVEDVADDSTALTVGKLDRASGDTIALVRSEADGADDDQPFSGDVAIALDVSLGQSNATLAAQIHLADAVLSDLGPDESFALLACDAACTSYPERGLASPTREALANARRFLLELSADGAADPAGALLAARAHLAAGRRGQVVLLTDGTATAGELSVASQLAHVAPALLETDVRIIGVGRAVDDRSASALGRGLGATYDRFASGASLAERVDVLRAARRAAVVRAPEVDLPPGLVDAQPAILPPTRVGEEVIVLARSTTVPADASIAQSPLGLGRLWAREQIAELETQGSEADAEITALALRHHLLARTTSLLVLENDAMFAQFGIPRTQPALVDFAAGNDGATYLPQHTVRAPQIRMGMTSVSGRLPPEIVQRIVRLNFGRMRACYQAGLTRDATLAGKVVTSFIITRDGSVGRVTIDSSELKDSATLTCLTRAFYALGFPQPEGGVVRVTYPIDFAPIVKGEAQREQAPLSLRPPTARSRSSNEPLLPRNSALNPPPWTPPPDIPPSAVHSAGSDAWLKSANSERLPTHLATLRAAVERDSARRPAHQQLVRALLLAGRLDEAHEAASELVELDPDFAAARELMAETAAATGEPREAVRLLAQASALEPRSRTRQLNAARAALAVGDAQRACAHLRALGELAPKEYEDAANACRSSSTPELPETTKGGFELAVRCLDAACEAAPPIAVVLTPQGRVLSPWTSGDGSPDHARGGLTEGTYRTLIVGGKRHGSVEVAALGTSFTASLTDDERTTAVVSKLTFPPVYRAPRIRY